MPFRQVTVGSFPAIALRGDALELIVVPSLGMKVAHLRTPRGREWLWRNPHLPLTRGADGASYVRTADTGGWDECFPTVGPCDVEVDGRVVALPDHGEVWSAEWRGDVRQGPEGVTLASVVRGLRFPYELLREITVAPDAPRAEFRYVLRHTGEQPFPWIWSSHPLLNVQPGTTLTVPGLRQVQLDAVHGRDDLAAGDIASWPGAFGGAGETFTFPEIAEHGWAAKLFGDVGPSGTMTLTDPRRGETLAFRVDPARVPQVGLWLNCHGWSPDGSGIPPYYNLALEPCIGAPDRLDVARDGWGMAQTLEPGEVRRWEIEVTLG